MSFDLLACHAQSIPPFLFLPAYDHLYYKGISDRLLYCEGVTGEEREDVFIEYIIRRDEATLWQACSQMVEFHVSSVKEKVKGSFSFDLVGLEFYEGLSDSDWSHMRELIFNHAQKLKVTESTWIKYRSLYGILKKHTLLDWGKISFSHCVRVLDVLPEKLDLHIKKLRKGRSKGYIMLHDLSRMPLFDRDNIVQQERLRKLFTQNTGDDLQSPRVLITHRDALLASSQDYSDSDEGLMQ